MAKQTSLVGLYESERKDMKETEKEAVETARKVRHVLSREEVCSGWSICPTAYVSLRVKSGIIVFLLWQ